MGKRTAILILGLFAAGALALACGDENPGRAAYDAGRFEDVHAEYVARCEAEGEDAPPELLCNRALAALGAKDFRDAAEASERAHAAAEGEVGAFAVFLRGNAAFGLCELAEEQANTLEAEPFAFDIAISFGESARDHWIDAATSRDDWPAARRNVERALTKLDVLRAKKEEAKKQQEKKTAPEPEPEPEPEDEKEREKDDPAFVELSESEVARLLERLAEKEREKTDLRKSHRKTAQAGVEKDW